MRLSDRLKKLEAKASPEHKIFIIKYGTELNTLRYGEDKHYRLKNETENEFAERISALVKKDTHPNIIYLVGNIC